MDSPSAQLVEQSIIDFGPPSSPFVTEVENASRSPSKQRRPRASYENEEQDEGIMSQQPDIPVFGEDKENVAQDEATSTLSRMFASPKKPTTPQRVENVKSGLSSSHDSNVMPPPSIRKASLSPKKTPKSRSTRSGANTPRSVSRELLPNLTPAQDPAAFQAGLDARNDMMAAAEDQMTMDDTCFSTFSEIPDMTTFAKLRQSPTKQSEAFRTPRGNVEPTPRTSRKRSSDSRSPSPTPRKQKTPATNAKRDDTGSFLIDFTQQLEGVTNHFSTSPAKSHTESNLLQYINNQRSPNKSKSHAGYTTPSKSKVLNLLDFELPPAPTPRSIPTITVRELESLKSSYLSQISSLKATLSGREAEVDSLKKAVGDAERRVGEAQETLRDEKSKREYLELENESWKKRGVEFESVLKNVKEEVLKGEAEKEDLHRKLEDAEKRVEDGEARAVKAEERFADALAARANAAEGGDSDAVEEQVQRLVAAQIDAKIESVSRELHSVYKEKHERKVGTLKKSYEARSEKKTAELQARVTELEKTNEELQAAKDATFSGPLRDTGFENPELKAQIEEQNAAIARLKSEMEVSRKHQEKIERELTQERIEKGDLVASVDELLELQAQMGPPATPQGAKAISVVEDFRKSISRPPSGLRAPAGSGIPAGPAGLRAPTTGLNRSTSGGGGKSRMLANIEKMGRTGSGNSVNGTAQD